MALDNNAPHHLHGFKSNNSAWNTLKVGKRFMGLKPGDDPRDTIFDTEELKPGKSRPLTNEASLLAAHRINQITKDQIASIATVLGKVTDKFGDASRFLKYEGVSLKPSTFEEQEEALRKMYGSERSFEDATIFEARTAVSHLEDLTGQMPLSDRGPVKVDMDQKLVSTVGATFPLVLSAQKRLMRNDRIYFYSPELEGDQAFHSFTLDAIPQVVEIAKTADRWINQ